MQKQREKNVFNQWYIAIKAIQTRNLTLSAQEKEKFKA